MLAVQVIPTDAALLTPLCDYSCRAAGFTCPSLAAYVFMHASTADATSIIKTWCKGQGLCVLLIKHKMSLDTARSCNFWIWNIARKQLLQKEGPSRYLEISINHKLLTLHKPAKPPTKSVEARIRLWPAHSYSSNISEFPSPSTSTFSSSSGAEPCWSKKSLKWFLKFHTGWFKK